MCQCRTTLDRNRPNSCRIRASSAKDGPESIKCGPASPEIVPSPAISAKFAPEPKLTRIRLGLESAKLGPKPAKFVSNSTNFGTILTTVGQISDSGPNSISAKNDNLGTCCLRSVLRRAEATQQPGQLCTEMARMASRANGFGRSHAVLGFPRIDRRIWAGQGNRCGAEFRIVNPNSANFGRIHWPNSGSSRSKAIQI